MNKRKEELGLAAVHLERALREEGCSLCRRIREAEERWIWNVLYELTGDPESTSVWLPPSGFAGNMRPSWSRWCRRVSS